MTLQPHPKAPGLAVAITEPMIRELVNGFYADVRRDPLLGPIFESRVADWDHHLDTLTAFWSSIALTTGRYKGRPMAAHIAIPEMSRGHFERWLALFRVRATSICPPAAAAFFIDRAERIASSLHMGISLHRGAAPGTTPLNFGSQSEPTE